jgi:hypothetical protein
MTHLRLERVFGLCNGITVWKSPVFMYALQLRELRQNDYTVISLWFAREDMFFLNHSKNNSLISKP